MRIEYEQSDPLISFPVISFDKNSILVIRNKILDVFSSSTQTEKTGVWKISIEINLFLYSSPTLSPILYNKQNRIIMITAIE